MRRIDPHAKTWAEVYWYLTQAEKGSTVEVHKSVIAHPSYNGAYKSVGLPKGQIADWRFPPDPEGRGLHIHDVGWGWRAHLDEVHPDHSIVGHFVRDVLP